MNSQCLKIGFAPIFVAACALALIWYFCRPVFVVHYSKLGSRSVGLIYDTDLYLSRRSLNPGESARYFTDWRQEADYWTGLSVLAQHRDEVEITGSFSRIDLCVGPSAKIERVETRHGFSDRFTDPNPPCE